MDDGLTVTAELHYANPEAALPWLTQAFGFRTRMIVRDDSGRIVFAEMGYGNIVVAIVPENEPLQRSPASIDGLNTQVVRIRGNFDVDRHCAQAQAAGARILQAPTQFFFGDRVYVAADIEGHLWSFAQHVPGAGGPPPDGWSIQFPPTQQER